MTLEFSRARVAAWACDVSGSTAALNSRDRVDDAEKFLQRLYWLTGEMGRVTGAAVTKWTGDGFLLAYPLTLDRDLAVAGMTIINAAWHMSYLANVTSLAVTDKPFLRLRHGIAFDADAIIVTSGTGAAMHRDVIGRGIVFATRLAALRAPFPNCVMHGEIIRAAEPSGIHQFRKRRFSANEVSKFFKGQQRWTNDVFESYMRPARYRSPEAVIRKTRTVLASIGSREPPYWLPPLMTAMDGGPEWARQMKDEWLRFTRAEMFGGLIATLDKATAQSKIK